MRMGMLVLGGRRLEKESSAGKAVRVGKHQLARFVRLQESTTMIRPISRLDGHRVPTEVPL
jgi:hypothetical protein